MTYFIIDSESIAVSAIESRLRVTSCEYVLGVIYPSQIVSVTYSPGMTDSSMCTLGAVQFVSIIKLFDDDCDDSIYFKTTFPFAL